MSVLPVFLFQFVFMDIFYVLNSTLFEPFALLLGYFGCCNTNDNLNWYFTKANSQLYVALFQMSKQEMAGIRHMRAITQLGFQTPIMIVLSIIILAVNTAESETGFGGLISTKLLIASMVLAIVHLMLELAQLKIEVRLLDNIVELPFSHYYVNCFNGRLGWIPLKQRFKSEGNTIIDYDSVQVPLAFQASISLVRLEKQLIEQSHYNQGQASITVKLGECLENLQAAELHETIRVCERHAYLFIAPQLE